MNLRYKSYLQVLLLVLILQNSLFPQQNNNVWKWWHDSPGVRYFVSLICFNDILLVAGEGSTLYSVNSGQVFSNLNKGPQINIVDMTYDPVNNDILVLVGDYNNKKFYLFSVSSNGEINTLATFNETVYSVTTDKNMTVLGAKGKIKTSTDRKQFTDNNNPDIDENNCVIKTPDQSNFITFGKSKKVNDSGIRITKDFKDYKTPLFGWELAVMFDEAEVYHPVPNLGLHKAAQDSSIFAVGFQAATYSYVVCRSTDEGETWDSVFAGPQNLTLNSISVGSGTNVIIGGNGFGGGVLYYSKDGGNTWAKGYNSSSYIYSITHISPDSAYAFGEKGLILLTTDAGASWTQLSDDNTASVSGIYFPSPSTGYAAGLSGSGYNILNVYKTTDAGGSWQTIYNDSSFSSSNAFLNSVFFIDDMTGFIAGSKLIKTTDGGITWKEQNTGAASYSVYRDVYFLNGNLGFAVYGDGAVKTTDGGDIWTPLNINTDNYDKQYVYFVDENLGFISGNSRLYRTTDGGDNWDTLAVGNNKEDLNSKVNFINSTTGFFGKKGQVFKTTDKGDTWTDAPIDDHSVPQQIQFVSDSVGYIICASDTFGIPLHVLFKTTNGGRSWFELTEGLPGSTGFRYLYFTDENTGYLAGSAGIIKTTTGGESVTSVRRIEKAAAPSGYILYQNYPNPFNPATKIRYSIPTVHTHGYASVQLEIFDLLGRKIATLVNKKQRPGEYEVEFDASRLSSGVYFYRLSIYNKHITKKLVLLK